MTLTFYQTKLINYELHEDKNDGITLLLFSPDSNRWFSRLVEKSKPTRRRNHHYTGRFPTILRRVFHRPSPDTCRGADFRAVIPTSVTICQLFTRLGQTNTVLQSGRRPLWSMGANIRRKLYQGKRDVSARPRILHGSRGNAHKTT